MKTTMISGVTDSKIWDNKYTEKKIFSTNSFKKEIAIRMDSQSPIIESIIETIVEPIIFKC